MGVEKWLEFLAVFQHLLQMLLHCFLSPHLFSLFVHISHCSPYCSLIQLGNWPIASVHNITSKITWVPTARNGSKFREVLGRVCPGVPFHPWTTTRTPTHACLPAHPHPYLPLCILLLIICLFPWWLCMVCGTLPLCPSRVLPLYSTCILLPSSMWFGARLNNGETCQRPWEEPNLRACWCLPWLRPVGLNSSLDKWGQWQQRQIKGRINVTQQQHHGEQKALNSIKAAYCLASEGLSEWLVIYLSSEVKSQNERILISTLNSIQFQGGFL